MRVLGRCDVSIRFVRAIPAGARQRPWLSVLALLMLLQAACATGDFRGTGMASSWPQRGVPSSYKQSCALNAVCAAPAASGELVVPTTAQKLVQAAEAVQGLLTLKDFLDEAEVARVEEVLVQCAKEADYQVNQREYPKEGYPSDAECDRVVGYDKKGEKVTRAMELGTMKHDAAFSCVERELGREFSDHITREPRYGKKPPGEEYALTDKRTGSLVPDIVLHLVRDANTIQLVYDFFFPCTSSSKSDPLGRRSINLKVKQDKYTSLGGNKKPALVTSQLGVSR
jgi:hypothetical protein